MKAVMLSIRPKWCDRIATGEKTIEIRKSKPKLEPPFKCYIYPQQHRAVVYIKNSFTYIHINISSSARRGRGGDNLRQSKKSLIIQINALEDRVKSLTQQLITVANKPPLKIPMKGYYWKFNTKTQIWELKPFDWLTIDDIRQLNGLEKEVQRHK